ncbi:hypothetical protein FRB93_009815 [Tulasnella sp. JGI-2019a]|nr:hypothetical protein FRB93_009815 [Tulasnella sp. JGI-2019a]
MMPSPLAPELETQMEVNEQLRGPQDSLSVLILSAQILAAVARNGPLPPSIFVPNVLSDISVFVDVAKVLTELKLKQADIMNNLTLPPTTEAIPACRARL